MPLLSDPSDKVFEQEDKGDRSVSGVEQAGVLLRFTAERRHRLARTLLLSINSFSTLYVQVMHLIYLIEISRTSV
jgi:hypothetical protein